MKRLITCSILVTLLAACGGGGDDDPTATVAPTTTSTNGSVTATSVPTTEPAGEDVGIVDNADGEARVNSERANQNRRLRAGDLIETGDDSSIDFTLDGAPEVECKTLDDSKLIVRPGDGTQIRWQSRAGVSFCTVDRGSPPVAATFGIDPNVTLEVDGTLFGISDDGTVRVVEGFVLLTSGGNTQRIGPNEGVTLSDGGPTGPPEVWQGLEDDQSELVADLQASRTPPSTTPTAAEFAQSPLLRDMRANEALIVILDESATYEDESFMWDFFGRLHEAWVGTSDQFIVEYGSREYAEGLMRQSPGVVFITPAHASGQSQPAVTPTGTGTAAATTAAALTLDRVPFYITPEEVLWYIEFERDPAAADAFTRFTGATLYTGEYFDMYYDIFQVAPSYDLLLKQLR